MISMLGALAYSWDELAQSVGWTTEWLGNLLSTLSDVLWVALAIAGAAGAIYAIWIGIKMAKAESSDEREESKKHLINVIIAIVVVIALIVVFNTLLPMVISAIIGTSADGASITSLVTTMKCLAA